MRATRTSVSLAAPVASLQALFIATLLATTPANADQPPQPPASTTHDAAASADTSPLIAYAQELGESESHTDRKAEHLATTSLRAVTFEMSRHPPPPDAECANTLGAQRFAEVYSHLATIQRDLGNFEAVIAANKSALACEPRVAIHEALIASAHLSLGQLAEARAAIERGNVMDPDDVEVRNTRARIDFIQEHWADAIARFRLESLTRDGYSDYYANYLRCYLWLAQRRAGVRNPELPPKATPRKSPGANGDTGTAPDPKRWPVPILETLQGERSEADLVQVIRDDTTGETRQWLTEALYYIGELKLANGDVESARRHFASVINLRVLNFVEYGMARAELARMREREPVAEAATP